MESPTTKAPTHSLKAKLSIPSKEPLIKIKSEMSELNNLFQYLRNIKKLGSRPLG
jgi:hypothetical protein